ncbi:SIS domain-containing protein [Herbaspirillum huttiense]|uniref:KpsF/GutQ family sugar-phosphate isomerase n=3 Tax=Herbaspirillum huttiense TaxID=863372 RepID=A0AAJ2H8D7_9BURK|nr:KpsF/GutQ family sugar-phosphate isomerase [Herbaspirillum huttiense]MDR9834300.1 KpsF/GutQ family sugar-phosphate isomerase [Herbaspirillum huttiense]UWE18565.1 KpsF/GutQ family sugar-phosphate isomerase [Herbaspirillum huttiense]
MRTTGLRVFQEQAQALNMIAERLAEEFEQAVELMYNTRGRVIVSGMGKSGIIGSKIAATLASTGTSSFFVHPGEAYHGDLGMFTEADTAILISYSGETEEVIRLIPSLKHFGLRIIAIVGKRNSTLGKNADVVLDVSVPREACPNNLAPTTSTTATLVMGDALAVALIEKREFKPNDFARFHPGGSLGKRLLTRVKDVMHTELPWVMRDTAIVDVISQMTEGGLGMALVSTDGNRQALCGVITDGDLRRALAARKDIYHITAADLMNSSPKTVSENEMFVDAEAKMLELNITALVALNDLQHVVGVLKLLDAKRL